MKKAVKIVLFVLVCAWALFITVGSIAMHSEMSDEQAKLQEKYNDLKTDYDLLKMEYDLINSDDYSETLIMDTAIKQVSEDATGGKVGSRYIAVFPFEEFEGMEDHAEFLGTVFSTEEDIDSLMLIFVESETGHCIGVEVKK